MKGHVRTVIELLLLCVLAGGLLIGVSSLVLYAFDDEKTQYFLIGYYVANHKDLALWIWKRLGIEKRPDADEETQQRQEQR